MNRDSREGSLLRAVGIWGLAANIVNLTVGGGIFRLPAAAATALGAAAPVAYLVCALLMGLIVLCFAEAGSRVSLTGGLYAYIEVAFGPLAGFMTGVLLWAAMTAATAAIASFFADALSALVPAFGVEPTRSIMLVCLLAGFAGLNIAGARARADSTSPSRSPSSCRCSFSSRLAPAWCTAPTSRGRRHQLPPTWRVRPRC
jgi:basic amino acid/polyamine antiporter, APA family